MAKRKVVMKNIIYELDNDDIEISSDDEVSTPKLVRFEPPCNDKPVEIDTRCEPNGAEVLSVDSTDDSICLINSPIANVNGGKTTSDAIVTDSLDLTKTCEVNSQDGTESDCVQSNPDSNKIILNDDTEVESPPSLCTAGCENRIPLVTMRFKNSKLSKSCKMKVKDFIVNLLKEKQGESLADSDNDTDHELDIWPEDLVDECIVEDKPQEAPEENLDCDNTLFFIDTAPCNSLINDVPKYSQVSSIMSNLPEDDVNAPKSFRRVPKCFNCDGDHWLRDCKYPRNPGRIAERRHQAKVVGRYHIEDDQKYGHLTPGRISGALRHALGLKRNAIPLHIYRMRMLGYPPGWLEEARISHSGISMFDSTGHEIMDPEDEDGEICEAGSKDKFDIKKILDFPGFNVPASSRYVEEAHMFGLPSMSEQDSKIAMLQMLAPNAMKAYKRKKLTLFPSAANSSLQEGQAEMDLDSGDEGAMFPSVPPLPDEAPPPLPPPPEQPPPPQTAPPADAASSPEPASQPANTETEDLESSDLEITSVVRVSDIPIPEDSLIVIDECYENEKPDSGRTSPSLDDLEKKKQDLMKALEGDASQIEPPDNSVSVSDDTNTDVVKPSDESQEIDATENNDEKSIDIDKDEESDKVEIILDDPPSTSSTDNKEVGEGSAKDTAATVEGASTPEQKTGHVKTTSFGTPVLNNLASSFVSLPSDEKFAKHICDVINFENLPNSTGKYKKISSMLKKVKTEVDRIQDS